MTILRRFWTLALGILLVAGAAVVLFMSSSSPVNVVPASGALDIRGALNSETIASTGVLPVEIYAAAIALAVGLALVAGWVGFRIGARRTAHA